MACSNTRLQSDHRRLHTFDVEATADERQLGSQEPSNSISLGLHGALLQLQSSSRELVLDITQSELTCNLNRIACVTGQQPEESSEIALHVEASDEDAPLAGIDGFPFSAISLQDVNGFPYSSVPMEVKAYVAAGGQRIAATVGPTIPWLRVAVVTYLWTQILFYILANFSMQCATGVSSYSQWVWLAILPFAAVRFLVEWRCVIHCTPPFIMIGGRFEVLGFASTFAQWLSFGALCSALNLADICFDGGFAAATRHSLHCKAGKRLETLWAKQWSQSLLGLCGVPSPSLDLSVLSFWLFSLVQIVLPLVIEIFYCVAQKGAALERVQEQKGPYDVGQIGRTRRPCSKTYITYGGRMFSMADACGMATMQQLALAPSQAKLFYNHTHPWTDLAFAEQIADLLISRMALTYIGEHCVQLNLQSTIFGLTCYCISQEEGSSNDLSQVVVSICLSMIMTLLKLKEVSHVFECVATTQSRLELEGWLSEHKWNDCAMRGSLHELNTRWYENAHEVNKMITMSKERWRKVQRSIWIARAGVVVMVASLLFSLLQLCASFLCTDSAFNITGCVEF